MKLFKNDLTVLFVRLSFVYIVFMLCRIAFYFFNNDLIDPLTNSSFWSLLRGSLMFDTVSIIYLNLLFIALSLAPFGFRENKKYRKIMLWVFMISNGLGLLVNVSDIFYYPFKQARIVLGDFFMLKEDSFLPLLADFVADYWYGFVLYFILLGILYLGYKSVAPGIKEQKPNKRYYAVHSGILAVMVVVVIFFIRGATFSASAFPITMNDAFLYTDNPTHTSFILSNPFCVLRTLDKSKKVTNVKYFDDALAQNICPTTHKSANSAAFETNTKTNVVLIILESFGKAHIKGLSDQFKPGQQSNTPFIDSLLNESYVFTNAYQNGRRSIDALPAIWASIPSFKDYFLALPNSVAPYHGLPQCMDEMGYQTSFFHGGVKESMGFVSFGKVAGVKEFYSREEYEAENGTQDFDGKWGIWDHKFLPYMHKKLNGMYAKNKPFFATVFTLSSHHPYSIPAGMEAMFTEGTLPIHRAIKYSDYSLQQFFSSIKNEPWYNNTLFIITADHSSGADSQKYKKQPNEYGIPIVFFRPGTDMKGKDDRVMQHIDIMPTLLGMLDYDKPYFAFGTDHFDAKHSAGHFTINYANGAYNCTTDKYCYFFNEEEVFSKIDYRKDPLGKHNLITRKTKEDEAVITEIKAFVQEYYLHLNNRNYLPADIRQNQMAMMGRR